MSPNAATETVLIGLIKALQSDDESLMAILMEDLVNPAETLSEALGMIVALLEHLEGMGYSTDEFLSLVALLVQSGDAG